jgi:hypothetical protein
MTWQLGYMPHLLLLHVLGAEYPGHERSGLTISVVTRMLKFTKTCVTLADNKALAGVKRPRRQSRDSAYCTETDVNLTEEVGEGVASDIHKLVQM